MSTDTMPGRTSGDTAVQPWTGHELQDLPVAPHLAPPSPGRVVGQRTPAAQDAQPTSSALSVSAATLAAHAIDRAEARLERLRDDLALLRATATPGADIDARENGLIFAIAEAERSRRALDV